MDTTDRTYVARQRKPSSTTGASKAAAGHRCRAHAIVPRSGRAIDVVPREQRTPPHAPRLLWPTVALALNSVLKTLLRRPPSWPP